MLFWRTGLATPSSINLIGLNLLPPERLIGPKSPYNILLVYIN